MNRNTWNVAKDVLVGWCADVSALQQAPDVLMRWLASVIELGELCEVFTVLEAPLVSYRRDRPDAKSLVVEQVYQREQDGPIIPILESHYRQRDILDVLHFANQGVMPIDGIRYRYRNQARLAYFNADGGIEVEMVEDIGKLMNELGHSELFRRSSPLEARGTLIDFRHPENSLRWVGMSDQVCVRFQLFTDIWFPWVSGVMDPAYQRDHMFRNPLAQYHTPRSNQFIRGVRESTERIGGTSSVETDVMGFASPDGIDLNTLIPGRRKENLA
jgi:hypothetical protein